MKYALLGDLHSSIEDTKAVLFQIEENELSNQIIGLGDLYECLVGKSMMSSLSTKLPLKEAAMIPNEFEQLLTFPSVIGNQEERIALATGESHFLNYPEKITIENATIIHGHQLFFSDSYEIQIPKFETSLLFFGHSHYAALYEGIKRNRIKFDKPYYLGDGKQHIINVGSVVDHREWCIYDSEEKSVIFKKAK